MFSDLILYVSTSEIQAVSNLKHITVSDIYIYNFKGEFDKLRECDW